MVVVDTAPVQAAGALPGVLLVSPIDGTDAIRNLTIMLRGTPKNTEVVLAKYHRTDQETWLHNVDAISEAAGVDVIYLPDPIPDARPVREAHDAGISVWDLPRRGNTQEFLSAVETVAGFAWKRMGSEQPIPTLPRRRATEVYVPGWSDDEEA
jgi:hypothetical protein